MHTCVYIYIYIYILYIYIYRITQKNVIKVYFDSLKKWQFKSTKHKCVFDLNRYQQGSTGMEVIGRQQGRYCSDILMMRLENNVILSKSETRSKNQSGTNRTQDEPSIIGGSNVTLILIIDS